MVKFSDSRLWLWRAVDQLGVVLDETFRSLRDKQAAKQLLRKLMKRTRSVPKPISRTNSAHLARPDTVTFVLNSAQ
ncbi:DDE-type integrase/transposase/recombinase [Thioclava sp. GXIMD4216]|uniref:DDE-type integrase/transposase/recombinase n=1 Tax=Thioclava sp. GXIMD4216 TaxID=3131929 RepID=UPI0030CD1765